MAHEKDFDLLDDFLSNRLNEADRIAFEKKLESDASLRTELNLQQQIVNGIQKARVAELKSMLNEIAIPAQTAGTSLFGKFSVGLLTAALLGIALYFWFGSKQPEQVKSTSVEKPSQPQPGSVKPQSNESSQIIANDEQKEVQTQKSEPKQQSSAGERKTNPIAQQPNQPKLDVYDPTQDVENGNQAPEEISESGSEVSLSNSSIAVELDESNKKLNFHYQFSDGRLLLYGSFDKNLYEILEFFSNNKRTIFLYYNSNYYLLDETQVKPTPLAPITDPTLQKKLKEYRNN